MYAIIATGGKQYRVSVGDKVRVEKLDVEVGSTVTFDQVLLVSAEKVKVGSPCVKGATVEAEVLSQGKEKKVIVYKYKPKTGYHKKNGHRQLFTELSVKSISVDGVALSESEKPAKKTTRKSTKKVEEVAEEVVEKAEPVVEAVENPAEVAE